MEDPSKMPVMLAKAATAKVIRLVIAMVERQANEPSKQNPPPDAHPGKTARDQFSTRPQLEATV